MTNKLISVWLLTSALALCVGGYLVRNVLATPPPDWGGVVSKGFSLPLDPLGLAVKWFLLAGILIVLSIVVFVASRKQQSETIDADQQESLSNAPSLVQSSAIVFGFWLCLICAIELSATQWTYTSWGESKDWVTEERKNDPHLLIFDSQYGAGVRVYRIISQQRSNAGLSYIASVTDRKSAAGLRQSLKDRFKDARTRKLLAAVFLLSAIGLAVWFYKSVLRKNHEGQAPA